MKKEAVYALPFLAFCMMMMIGCGNKTGSKSAFEAAESYSGTIPCADCEGIEMTLKVSSDYQKFELTETYKGGKDETFVEMGKMNTERGFENDNDATVFILNSDKAVKEQRYFVRYTGENTKIHMLSSEKKRIVSSLNYTLDKQ